MGDNTNINRFAGIMRAAKGKFLFFLWIWLCGIISILFLVASYKARVSIRPLVVAEQLLNTGKFEVLLEEMDKTDLWTSNFPAIDLRRRCHMIRCHVRLGNTGTAEALAEHMLGASNGKRPDSPGNARDTQQSARASTVEQLAYLMEKPFDALINSSHNKDNIRAGYSNWTGYQTLSEELKRINDTNTLARVMNNITKRDANSRIAKSITTFLSTASSRGRAVITPKNTRDASIPGWAIVTGKSAKTYDKQGKFLDYVSRGAVVEISEIKDTKAGQVAICALHSKDSATPGLIMLTSDLDLKKGAFINVDGAILNLFIERSALIKDADQIQEQLIIESDAKNPHTPAYRQTARLLKDFSDKVAAMKTQFAASTGADRQALHDAMRPMKTDQLKLEENFAAAKKKYDGWKQQNDPAILNTSKTTSLRNKLESVESQLRSMKQL